MNSQHNDVMMEVIERVGELEWNSTGLNTIVATNYDEFSSFMRSAGEAMNDHATQLFTLETGLRQQADDNTAVISRFQSALAMTGRQVTDLKQKDDLRGERIIELEGAIRQETQTRRNEIADQNDVITTLRDQDGSIERDINLLQDQQRKNQQRITEAFAIQSRQTGRADPVLQS